MCGVTSKSSDVSDTPQIVLASASPRRAELLDAIGIRYRVQPADIDERPLTDEPPLAFVRRVAEEKAAAVVAHAEGLPVLAADTIVVVDGRILGKPAGRDQAVAMLDALSGRSHEVITAIAVATLDATETRHCSTRVTFRHIDRAEAQAYWASGEPRDKAGGYGVQGIGGIFVDHIEGSYSGVVGLPVAETEALLRAFGVNTWRYRGG